MRYADIGRHAPLFQGYTELRVQENSSRSVNLLNGDVIGNSTGSQAGVSARAYANGAWGFASTPETDDAAIGHCIRRAADNARSLGTKAGKKHYQFPSRPARGERDLGTEAPMPEQKTIIDFARALDAYCATRFPKLVSRSVNLACGDSEKTLVSSDGSVSYSLLPRTILYASFTMERDGQPVDLYTIAGGGKRFGELFSKPEDLYGRLDELFDNLSKKAAGVYARPGTHDVVLGSDLAGILAHEAIGHTVEADFVQGGSVAADYLGKEVASPLVTLTDFAHTALGQRCPVPLWIDDEGTEARDAILIERGVLKSYMHNKESAARMGHELTGNARAYGFYDEPLIRMRNTAILPGSAKLQDMIASVDDGYYFTNFSNGQADSTSEFMFGVVYGYEIKGGKLGQAVRDCTISGVAFDMLKTVTMVGDTMSWSSGGMCGKKQSIPVGMGGPALRCRINVGGRA